MPGVKNIGFLTLWSCDGRVCIRVWPQRVDALRVSRSFVVSSICIYTVRFSVIIKEGLLKCETLKNETRPCGMKMIILGGGCFEPSLIRLQHGLNQLYKRWKINTLTRMHSSRMRTVRSSSRPGEGGLHQAPLWTRHTPSGSDPPRTRHPRDRHPPPVDRMTDRCKHITLPQTSLCLWRHDRFMLDLC